MKHTYSFDESTHTYTIDGRNVPSVTTMIREVLGGITASQWHMDRGTAVHAAAAMIALGKNFTVDPQYAGRVDAVRRWYAENRPEWLMIEQTVYSVRYQYAGRLDLVCKINGTLYLVDFKGTLTPMEVAIQCAFYSMADNMPPVRYALGVETRDDGTYKTSDPIDLRKARNDALAVRAVYGIKQRMGRV